MSELDTGPPPGADEPREPDGTDQPDPGDRPADGSPEPARPGAVEARVRRLVGRTRAYRGPIVAMTRGWVSRDTRLRFLAARFLDFVVLTEDHLVLCSTGFFTRRPRRLVLREPLGRLTVVGRGPDPERALRVVGDFKHPILIELKADTAAAELARALLARTRPALTAPEHPGEQAPPS